MLQEMAGKVGLATASGAWKLAARAGATIVTLAAFISVVATTLRAREEILSSADPAPVLARIAADGYEVCYANYWQAYQLQFLSDETVKFIPWHSLNRNPELLTYPFDELSGRVIGWGDATGSRGGRGPGNARPRTGGEWTA